MSQIEKAPIDTDKEIRQAGYIFDRQQMVVVGHLLESRRDADDKHYREAFVKWLKEHTCKGGLDHYCPNCDSSFYGVKERDIQILLKEVEKAK